MLKKSSKGIIAIFIFVLSFLLFKTCFSVNASNNGELLDADNALGDTATVRVSSITLNKTVMSVAKGKTATLKATIAPTTATNKNVTWTSSDTNIATVSADGVVKGVKVGTATITAKTADGGKKATCTVSVVIKVSSVTLNKTTLDLYKGKGGTLIATVSPSNATDKTVTWSSSDTSIATVSTDGVVKGIKEGTATITAKTVDGGKIATCTVTVKIKVTGVKLNKTTLELGKGKTSTLTATVSPSNATNKTVTWSSSDTSVATVSSSGVVKGIKVGTATITAKTADGGKIATCDVTVAIKVTGVTLNKTSLSLAKGKTSTLTATVSPSNATNKTVTWSSSDTSVATVSSSGVVKGIKSGTATITATTVDGGKMATCDVKVTVKVTGVTLNKSTLNLEKGKTSTLKATVSPSDATNQNVTWTSSDTSVATVSSAGVVKGIKVGTATITAKTADGNKIATCDVTVAIKVTGVTLNKTTLNLEKGKTSTLKATVSPSDATNQNVTWTSSDTSVATVSSTGVVKGIKVGTATITAKTADGNKIATCDVKVAIKVTGVTLDKTTLELEKGKGGTLTATVSPSNATNKKVKWTSSDTSVATVSSSGVVKGIKGGTATITATTEDGNKIATCDVKVIVKVTGVTLNKTTLSLGKGEVSEALKATVSPSDATNQTVYFTSSDASVAKVYASGVVKGLKAGTATITAKTADGNKIATCNVTVTIKVTGVTLNITSLSLGKGKVSEALKATVSPSDATDQTVYLTSSDPSVAKLYASGIVKGLKAGTATITAKTADGNKIATCNVTVTVKVTGVTLNMTSLSLEKGEISNPLIATVSPSDATNQTVYLTSSDSTIARVYASGVVKGLKAGTATITAKTADGSKKATCNVTVKNTVISKMYFIKAGDADSIIIESGGRYGLIDAAVSGNETVNLLNKLGVKNLDFVIATHSHGDHIGGMANVANKFINSSTKYYYRNPSDDGDGRTTFNKAMNAVKNKGAQLIEVTNKYPKFTFGDFSFELMNTETAFDDEKMPSGVVAGANKDSIVAYVLYKGNVGTLLTGDMESQDEYRMVNKLANKRVDVLKVGHHSWQSSTTMKFSKAIKPKIAIVTGKYLLDDISTSVYYMQQKYGTKYYVTQKSDGFITIDYSANLTVSPNKALVSNYTITSSSGHWRQLQNGIRFYLDNVNNLDSIVYNEWRTDNGKWYYMDLHGNMMTGWIEVNYKGTPELFYLGRDGAMLTGWQKAESYGPYNNNLEAYFNTWMYSHVNGTINAWYQYTTTWANGKNKFYFDPTTGVMQRNKTLIIGGRTYKFDKSGICVSGC